MIVYKDMITEDEMFTDSHCPRVVADFFYEVDSRFTTVSSNVDGRLIGANPSGEGGEDENVDDTSKRVIDLVHANGFISVPFDQKSYKAHLNLYLKTIIERLQKTDPDKVPLLKSQVNKYMKNVLDNFDQYEFYMGPSSNPDAMIVLMNFREDGMTPYFVFFKDGLTQEKY
ncbi:Translationally-controlled tumor protein homolog (TCTP) (Histamine-releasing factor), putative [Schistosoma mansoni]|uniref:Translationally-controlled tumor protein homolog n=2 Tax=Schistosoma mansoni TaxID=6183 RepID=A0A3Q0KG11_SCHMA|nr:Translationally-controlled tumor protein homolog (TCTP) (Histamine-releasing factor), putative [Schistosoma mansoni]|eukprot:XP_018646338.1 Translationally-controlled tumor protein homolog (TCTP) (Histamine-releasing factor), putative [Schistosoma mansoni]